MIKKTLISTSIALVGSAFATSYTVNNAQSSAMGNTGVASAAPANAVNFNPGLLADYSEDVHFGLTALSPKISLEDPLGFGEATNDFINVTFEDFTNVDLDAYNTALQGNGGSEPSLTQVFTDLSNTATDMTNYANAIKNDIDDNGVIDTPQNIQALKDANDTLETNSNTLDAKVLSIETQNNNVTTLSTNASSGLDSLSNRPAQLGLGFDAFNVAIPKHQFGMAVSLSGTASIGINAKVADSDLDQINEAIADLNEFTAQVSAITTELGDVTAENINLITLLEQQPDPADYTGGTSNPTYVTDIIAWGNNVQTQTTTVSNESDDVDTEVTGLENITTTNGTVVNGELQDLDFTLQSEINIVGASIVELAFSAARQFVIQDQYVAIGVTPKLQQISIFERTVILEEADDEADTLNEDPIAYLKDNSTVLYRANVDVGAAKTWDYHGKLRAGVALKDIIPWTLETDSGTELKIRPKLRVAAAHETKFTTVAIDLDITENKPLKYGVPSRYLGIGGEVRAWQHAALRAGYRNNLSVDDSHVLSTGIGLTPFGAGLDVGAWIKPEFSDVDKLIQDAGIVAQISVNF